MRDKRDSLSTVREINQQLEIIGGSVMVARPLPSTAQSTF